MESQRHKKQKERIRDILRRNGYIAVNEFGLETYSPYHNKKVSYSFDVFAYSLGKGALAVEVNGIKGHDRIHQVQRDKRRDEDILQAYPSVQRIHRLILSELEAATDRDIEEDLGLRE